MIRAYDPARNVLTDIAESQTDSEHYHAWTSDGILLESEGNAIRSFNQVSNQWQSVVLPANFPKKKISRIAVQKGKIAIVIDENP